MVIPRFRYFSRCAVLLLISVFAFPLHASITNDRQLFLKAEKALNKGDLKAWKKMKKKLVGYPLYADLIYKQAVLEIRQMTPEKADAILKSLENTPLQKTFRRHWLKRLAKGKRWKDYLKYYKPELGTLYRCHYANALYKNKQNEKAHTETRALWLNAKSQPDECDPAFEAMKKSGQLDNDLVWERIGLAINKGQTRLATYLKKSLTASEQSLVDEWLRIRQTPSRAFNKKYLNSSNPKRQEMLVYGVKRMALFDANKALEHWKKVRGKTQLNENQTKEIERYLALRMTTQRLDGAVKQHYLVQHPDNEILEWGVRAALREQDWNAADLFINGIERHKDLPDRWQYWKARTAEAKGESKTAEAIYHSLSDGRGYHNYLAADRVNLNYKLNNNPLQFSSKELAPLENSYGVRRAHELYILGRIPDARRDWYYLIKNYGDEDRQKLAYISKQWGWHSQAILTIAVADYYDDLSIRFPVLYEKELKKEARKNGLDPSWVIALVRQESAFQPDARSSAGARGLMQLMPRTSRYVARLLNKRKPKTYELYQPELNLTLGTHYLKNNMKRFGDHMVLTTAAYNAGPHRVSKWLPDNGSMEADVWTETIPFSETRSYVQRIMSYASIYDHLLGLNPVRVNQRMQTVANPSQLKKP
ncbi:MAG: hypothetical protein EP297_15045 [Gammaproteobacteria bacterium]|nr:MAG: hypothetical protein EP297_15045 [Gammaproteobacteria bacterium]